MGRHRRPSKRTRTSEPGGTSRAFGWEVYRPALGHNNGTLIRFAGLETSFCAIDSRSFSFRTAPGVKVSGRLEVYESMSRFRQSHHVDALQAFLSSTGASGQLARPGRCAEGSPRPDSRQPEHHKSTISRHLATRTSSASCIQSTHLHLDLFVVLFGIEAAVERALSPKLQGMLSLGTKRTTSLSQGGFGLSGGKHGEIRTRRGSDVASFSDPHVDMSVCRAAVESCC